MPESLLPQEEESVPARKLPLLNQVFLFIVVPFVFFLADLLISLSQRVLVVLMSTPAMYCFRRVTWSMWKESSGILSSWGQEHATK